jgi:hypothetical protein
VRNYLREEMASFLGLCEYMERADAARARAYFFDRRKSLLLYTERGQFYNRHRIRGAKVGFACRAFVCCHLGGQYRKLTGSRQPAVLGIPSWRCLPVDMIPPLPPALPPLQDILFYQLPEHPEFYSELLNLVEEGEGGETPTGGWRPALRVGGVVGGGWRCSGAGSW